MKSQKKVFKKVRDWQKKWIFQKPVFLKSQYFLCGTRYKNFIKYFLVDGIEFYISYFIILFLSPTTKKIMRFQFTTVEKQKSKWSRKLAFLDKKLWANLFPCHKSIIFCQVRQKQFRKFGNKNVLMAIWQKEWPKITTNVLSNFCNLVWDLLMVVEKAGGNQIE